VTTISPPSLPPAGTGPAPGQPSRRLPLTPGRRVALLLGVPVVLVVIAGNAYSLVQNVGKSSFPVSSSIPLADNGLTVSFHGGTGTVHGVASLAGRAQFHGTVNYDLARPAVHLGPGNLGVDCPGIDLGNCSLNATDTSPRGPP
jgi:hypothetical protein